MEPRKREQQADKGKRGGAREPQLLFVAIVGIGFVNLGIPRLDFDALPILIVPPPALVIHDLRHDLGLSVRRLQRGKRPLQHIFGAFLKMQDEELRHLRHDVGVPARPAAGAFEITIQNRGTKQGKIVEGYPSPVDAVVVDVAAKAVDVDRRWADRLERVHALSRIDVRVPIGVRNVERSAQLLRRRPIPPRPATSLLLGSHIRSQDTAKLVVLVHKAVKRPCQRQRHAGGESLGVATADATATATTLRGGKRPEPVHDAHELGAQQVHKVLWELLDLLFRALAARLGDVLALPPELLDQTFRAVLKGPRQLCRLPRREDGRLRVRGSKARSSKVV
mmetsp:Transcript_5898/g.22881  ORF Transcript_5898/g.22881 Transcript_5898/m.22881 type:complete len:336 (-) Transcript_5898:1724-2731(-)|eukprot:scaffold1426_cov263-Pinguiococcus_pyrenoidosus.AAC.2